MAVEVPEELLSQIYRCPDCAAEEGSDGLKPGREFNWAKAPRYASGFRRQSYCKRHQSIRNGAAQKERRKTEEFKVARRVYDRTHWRRYANKRYASWRAWYAKRREQEAKRYRAWVEANPEKRKVSQEAYRARLRWRSRPSVARAIDMRRRQAKEREKQTGE